MRTSTLCMLLLILADLALPSAASAGVEHPATTLYVPPACVGDAPRDDAMLLRCFAPVWIAPETQVSYNRIGTPEVYRGWLGGVKARVDPDRPTMFAEVRPDVIGDRRVKQLVYRVHFEKIPLRLSQFFFEAHDNPGLLLIVTLDAQSLEPLFVTTAHTCGCYRATLPTQGLDPDVLPEDWPEEVHVYGQRLPGVLPTPAPGRRVRVTLQATNHRVRALDVGAREAGAGEVVALMLRPMADLRSLPLEGGAAADVGSFFYTAGPLKGKVRGAWNPLEGLNVFGLVSLDPTVGMDKDFGDPEQTGTPFYTMLRFWKHDTSRLDRFDSLLRELGFRLDTMQAAGE